MPIHASVLSYVYSSSLRIGTFGSFTLLNDVEKTRVMKGLKAPFL